MKDSNKEAATGDKAARDLMLSELLQVCTPAPWRLDVGIDKTIFDANSNSLMDDASYYPSVPYNDNDWTLIALAPTIAAELIKERAVNANLLRVMRAIQHNGRIVGMVGFTEWATEAADLAIKQAEEL